MIIPSGPCYVNQNYVVFPHKYISSCDVNYVSILLVCINLGETPSKHQIFIPKIDGSLFPGGIISHQSAKLANFQMQSQRECGIISPLSFINPPARGA